MPIIWTCWIFYCFRAEKRSLLNSPTNTYPHCTPSVEVLDTTHSLQDTRDSALDLRGCLLHVRGELEVGTDLVDEDVSLVVVGGGRGVLHPAGGDDQLLDAFARR